MLPVVLWPGGKGGARRKPRRAKCPAEDSFGFPRETGGSPFQTRKRDYKARAGEVAPAEVSPHPRIETCLRVSARTALAPGPWEELATWRLRRDPARSGTNGGENSIRFERFTVFQASTSGGGHDSYLSPRRYGNLSAAGLTAKEFAAGNREIILEKTGDSHFFSA
jgi:hypothetical protein